MCLHSKTLTILFPKLPTKPDGPDTTSGSLRLLKWNKEATIIRAL